ncbi:28030_t:CDS:2 [Gigaspora margarita]|uniref:28030_t:CDS:1 n=1 Tax=Gigaspora margarita TaxID=4874 RepID=A0ABN7UYA1_GIGMA|nr:28030_t:CDS:2 [Gigaspora margarita]
MQNLKMIEKDSGNPELVLLQIVTTCWLSFSNVVKNLHQIINSVVEALLEDSLTDKIAKFLYSEIDNNFYLTTYYLSDILGYLRWLTLLFQANYISLFDIKLQLNATINAITTEFIEKNIDESEVPLFVQDFAKAVIESLKERFLDHDLIDSFYILDPQELPTNKSILGSYGQDSIQKLIEFYEVSKFVKGNI